MAEVEPPLLFFHTVWSAPATTVGTPKVTLVVPKNTPVGSALSLMAHEVMSPGPLSDGPSGKSLLAVLLVISTDDGE